MANTNESKKLNSKTKKKIIAGVLLLLLLISGFAIYNHFSNLGFEQSEEIVEMTDAEKQKYVNQKVKDSEINIQYLPNAIFSGNESEQFNVKNIENNKDDIAFILYNENGNEIYKSKAIKRGYQVNKITLDKKLSKGKHNCKISIGYVNKGGNVKSTFPITIQVK